MMAHSKSSADFEGYESDEELVQCGICLTIIDKPKALPCLHTFCQKCLSAWADSAARKQPDNTNVVSCPSCREDFPLPSGGVSNLKTNFFVTKLKERKSIQRKLHAKDAKIPCTSCTDGTSSKSKGSAVARCIECNDFLCDKCVKVHKSVRVLKKHQLLTFDELRSGTLAIHNLPEQELCPKHKGEFLRFYCETCDKPMCRDCTVVDHPRPEHKQVNLSSAAEERSASLLELAGKCQPLSKQVERAIEEDEKCMRDLDTSVKRAMYLIEDTTQRVVKTVLTSLQESGQHLKEELQQLEAERRKEIECHKENLELVRIRTRTALDMTNKVTQNGSQHDVATMYSSLSNTMTQLCDVKPTAIRKSISKLEFEPTVDESIVSVKSNFGAMISYNGGSALVISLGQGKLTTARCPAFISTTGDIAVTDHSRNKPVNVFVPSGKVKLSIDTTTGVLGVGEGDHKGYSQPWGLAIGRDGQYFVTDTNPYVKVFDAQGNITHRFGTMLSDGKWSYNKGSQLYGLAIGGGGGGGARGGGARGGGDQLFVGNLSQYVSVHNPDDGAQTSGIKIKIAPYFLAVTSDQNIVVSDHYQWDYTVHVYDAEGSHLHTFAKPEDSNSRWFPTGLCCTKNIHDEEEVYVACKKSPCPAIYRYSVTGEYQGVFTKQVNEPWGIDISVDGEKLAVADNNNTVKVFLLD